MQRRKRQTHFFKPRTLAMMSSSSLNSKIVACKSLAGGSNLVRLEGHTDKAGVLNSSIGGPLDTGQTGTMISDRAATRAKMIDGFLC